MTGERGFLTSSLSNRSHPKMEKTTQRNKPLKKSSILTMTTNEFRIPVLVTEVQKLLQLSWNTCLNVKFGCWASGTVA